MRHTQSRFPFPLVRPSFTAESLRGWWDGVVGREGQQQHRATTPTATPPLSRTLCGLRSHLEPSGRGRAVSGGRPDDNDQQTGTKQTDNSSRSSGGKSAGSNGRTTGSAATVQSTDRQTDRHSERQQRQNRSGRRKNQNSSTANDSAGVDGGRRQTRAATDTPLGVYCTRRKERHRPQPGWHAGHTFTRLT